MNITVEQAPRIDLETIGRSWTDFAAASQLRPVRHEADHDRMVSLMNALIDRVGDDASDETFPQLLAALRTKRTRIN